MNDAGRAALGRAEHAEATGRIDEAAAAYDELVAVDPADLRVRWSGVIWDAVLPADATTVTYPALQFGPATPVGAELRYLDASDVDAFASVTELYAEQSGADSPLAVPATGALRLTTGTATL